MKKVLLEQDRDRLNKRIREAEGRTGAQIVLAVINRSDSYAEIPWKAFALGVSLACLAVFSLNEFHAMILVAVTAILTAGGVCALLTVFAPDFARIFLVSHRAETEVRQYAQSLFLKREIFSTKNRRGVLLLVSLFERQVVVLPDRGLGERLTSDAINEIITSMRSHLMQGQIMEALEASLAQMTQLLEPTAPSGYKDMDDNELPDEIIEEQGI